MKPGFAKPILQGRPAVENPGPPDEIANDEITVGFLGSVLGFEHSLGKKLAMVVLFLYMQMPI